jgi:hypothetical protein
VPRILGGLVGSLLVQRALATPIVSLSYSASAELGKKNCLQNTEHAIPGLLLGGVGEGSGLYQYVPSQRFLHDSPSFPHGLAPVSWRWPQHFRYGGPAVCFRHILLPVMWFLILLIIRGMLMVMHGCLVDRGLQTCEYVIVGGGNTASYSAR